MNALLLLCLPKPIGAASSMHGINRAVRSDRWTAGGWDNSQRLTLETRDPWDYEKKKTWPASLLLNSTEATRGQQVALTQDKEVSCPTLFPT